MVVFDLNALNKALEFCEPISKELKQKVAERLNINETQIIEKNINLDYLEAPEFQNQFDIVCNAFFNEPQTMKEVDVLTGIMRENICRYVQFLRKQKSIFVVKKRKCNITKRLATALSTNPKYKDWNNGFTQLEFDF